MYWNIVGFIAMVFALCPGMLIVSLVKSCLNIKIDVGQMWTFSIIMSVAVFYGFFYKNKNEAIKRYLILCLTIVAFSAILHFGFKSEFPSISIKYFIR